jgi:ATP-binding cassette subfamily B protein
MLALLIVNLVAVYMPLLIRDSIDELRSSFKFEELLRYVVLILILASIMWAIRMYSRLSIFGVGRQVEFDLKQKIFQHLLILDPAYFGVNNSGDLMNRATSDVDSIRRLLGFAVLSLVNTFFAYVLTVPAMLAIDIQMSLAAISVYPLMLITVQLFSGQIGERQREVQEKLSNLSNLIQEDISGIAAIKIYAQEENERFAFRKKNRDLFRANLELAQTRNILFPLVEGLAYVSLVVLLWLGSEAIAASKITVGDLVALTIYVGNLVFPTALLGFTITAYQRGEISVDRVEAILTARPQVLDSPEAREFPLEKVKGKLTAQNLTYTYPDTKIPALNQINFTILPGETVAIVGPIGSGKSTLGNALPRLLKIGKGQLWLDEIDTIEIKLANLRGAIAYVPQDSFLFSTTIKNNIRYGKPLEEIDAIETAAKIAQIHPEIINFPQGYETLVGERGITLSGGQRQRTALARALLMDAPILILDDALSSVDNQTATQILTNLSSQRRKTVIFISHQLSAAAKADRIFVMNKGEIVQIGTHGELLEQPGLYQFLWQQHQLKEVLR